MKKSAKTNGWSRRWFVLNEKTGKVSIQCISFRCLSKYLQGGSTVITYLSIYLFLAGLYQKARRKKLPGHYNFGGIILFPFFLYSCQKIDKANKIVSYPPCYPTYTGFSIEIYNYLCIVKLMLRISYTTVIINEKCGCSINNTFPVFMILLFHKLC